MSNDDWNAYKLLILDRLEEIKEQNTLIISDVANLKTQIAVLKTKAAIWGSFAGAVVTFVAKKVF